MDCKKATMHVSFAFVQLRQEDTTLWWTGVRKRLPKALRRGFDSLFLLGWLIWKATPAQLVHQIVEEGALWGSAGYKHLAVLESRRVSLDSSFVGVAKCSPNVIL